jgi:hypothetical protein
VAPIPPAGKDSELSDTTELSQAIAALLAREHFSGPDFQVELSESFAPPAASRPVAIAILWQVERPVAILAGQRLTVARTVSAPIRDPLAALARANRLEIA